MGDRITDEPPGEEPWDVPPWERPGGFRRDWEPHRGPLLFWLCRVAALPWAVASLGSFATSCVPVALRAGPVALIGAYATACVPVALILGLVAWWVARRDLEQIRRGLMDPSGLSQTLEARRLGGWLACVGAINLALMLLLKYL